MEKQEPTKYSKVAEKTLGEKLRPSIFKRILAPLLDIVLIFFTFYGIYVALVSTPMADTMRGYTTTMQKLQDNFKLESGYGTIEIVLPDSDQGNYIIYAPDERCSDYYVVRNVTFTNQEERNTAYNAYVALINASDPYSEASTYYHIHNYAISLLAGAISEIIFLFLVPLVIPTGATLGMVIFSCRLINDRYWGKPKWYQHLGRFAFIYILESALPYFFLAQYTVLVMPVALFLLSLFNRKRKSLHDYVSCVMIAENAYVKEEL